ncbi:MAG: MraY family glycosyltransferase, partial [Bacteroidota bacterium]|nr:MraY family glycosyltransferase [Bacteroidota bacterium]
NFLMLDKLSYAIMCMAMTGSLLAFLAFNLFGGKNKIFMGDTGSLMMGLLLASLIIRFNEFSISQNQILSNFSPVLRTAIIAIPLIDMIRLFFIRMMKNKSPFSPDMNHIHHQLLALGLSHLMATTIITAFTILLVGMAYAFRNLNNHWLIILIILGTAMFMIIPSIIAAHTKPQRSTVKKIDFRNYVFPSRKFKQAWNPNAELTRKEPEQEAQEQQSV